MAIRSILLRPVTFRTTPEHPQIDPRSSPDRPQTDLQPPLGFGFCYLTLCNLKFIYFTLAYLTLTYLTYVDLNGH